MAETDYIKMMRESLEKKVEILEKIHLMNREQNIILQDPGSSPDAFDENVLQKENLINQMLELDQGFEQLYNRIKPTIEGRKANYSEEIRKMKMLITEITDLSSSIQAQEARNHELAVTRFSSVRAKAKEVRKGQQAVNTYYKNMMDQGFPDSQFMDKKN